MSKADQKFIKLCDKILTKGISAEGQEVRPKWDDGTPAHSIRIFGATTKYNLQKEFPAITLRQTYLKSAMDETLWMWQKHSNNINDLHSHIWDQWADEEGSIGKTYGYQLGVEHKYPEGENNQVDHLLYALKHNPFDRGHVVTMWCPADLHAMNLRPCLHTVTFGVTLNKKGEKILNLALNQRSQDVLTANNWNVCQYAILLMMIAQVSGMKPGLLVHNIVDAHIYDRHVPLVKEMIKRQQYPAPKVSLNPGIKNFYDFTCDDLKIEDYVFGEKINVPVAI